MSKPTKKMTHCNVSIQLEDFDLSVETRELQKRGADIGGIASFIGAVRSSELDSQQGALRALEIEHYPAMTQRSVEASCEQAWKRWGFIACTVIHRVGRLPVGAQIVLVIVAARHRKEAFAACEFIMDDLKTSAPFWKKAEFENSTCWVDAKTSDTEAMDKW